MSPHFTGLNGVKLEECETWTAQREGTFWHCGGAIGLNSQIGIDSDARISREQKGELVVVPVSDLLEFLAAHVTAAALIEWLAIRRGPV